MSDFFWLNLGLALLFLFASLCLVKQSKEGIIHRYRAKRLRTKLIPTVAQLIDRMIVFFNCLEASNSSDQVNIDQHYFLMIRARADVEELMNKSWLLYESERKLMVDFLQSLSAKLASLEQQKLLIDWQQTLLKGQRALLELNDIHA